MKVQLPGFHKNLDALNQLCDGYKLNCYVSDEQKSIIEFSPQKKIGNTPVG